MKLYLSLLACLFFITLDGQSEYIEIDGRRLEAVDVINRYGSKAHTTCTIDEVTALKDFSPTEIDAYKAKGRRRFVSKNVLDKDVFLEEMYVSEMNLYKYINEGEHTSFFLEDSLSIRHLEEGTYHDILLERWPSCIDSTILNNITYDWESIKGAIDMIRTCEEVYVPIPRSFITVNFGMEKALGLTRTRAPSIHPRLNYLRESWRPSHLTLGLGYLWKKPFAANFIGFNYGIHSSYRTYNGQNIFALPDGSLQEDKFDHKSINVAVPLSFEIGGKLKNSVYFLELGLEPSYNVYNDGLEQRIISDESGIDRTIKVIKVEDNMNFGIFMGTGSEFKIGEKQFIFNWKTNLRLGATNTRIHNKLAHTISLGYRIHSESVKVKKKRKVRKRKLKAKKRREKMEKKRLKRKEKREKDRLKKEEKKIKAAAKRAEKKEKDRLKREKKKAKAKAEREKKKEKQRLERLKKQEEKEEKRKKND